jgi:hypothetical protein
MSVPTSVLQFDALPPCEFEYAGNRYPSGRRSCKLCPIPCGVENPATCSELRKMEDGLRVKAAHELAAKSSRSSKGRKKRGRVEL